MNLPILLKTVNGRLQYYYGNNINFPKVHVDIDGNKEEIDLFPKEYIGVFETIYSIAEVWDKITELDHHIVTDFLAGERQYLDMTVLMMWIKNQTDIDSGKLMEYIIC